MGAVFPQRFLSLFPILIITKEKLYIDVFNIYFKILKFGIVDLIIIKKLYCTIIQEFHALYFHIFLDKVFDTNRKRRKSISSQLLHQNVFI